MVRLVQISKGTERCVALVDEPWLLCLDGVPSVYELAQFCARTGQSLSGRARQLATGARLAYDPVYEGRGDWSLLAPIDIPGAPERVLVSGTGLTHLGSAKDRQTMHLSTANDPGKPVTDSMRMFQSGLAGGRPADGEVGVAPEWFYKGRGEVLQAHLAPLVVPAYAEDGGEEAELAGVYLISKEGVPMRLGICAGNEFADHEFERHNYLNLAGSKLRTCSLGPELVVGAPFRAVPGRVSLERDGKTFWSKQIESGEENMAHSLANLEHHHFKFEAHRIPGHVHVHFFGAHSLSFGEGLKLQDGDWMQVSFENFGRPLRNPVKAEARHKDGPLQVQAMA